jgi:maltokinase
MGVLRRRAAEAFADVPDLAPHRAGVAALFDAVSERLSAAVERTGGLVPLQSIHGDLHLGQALYSPDGWKVLDFEGEPQRPVSERVAPDLPLRDVAGLLRSLDYAAAVGQATDPHWVGHAQISFLEGYREAHAGAVPAASGSELSVADAELLLRALVLDKALYEVVYEFRHRPAWMHIPLTAVERVLAS